MCVIRRATVIGAAAVALTVASMTFVSAEPVPSAAELQVQLVESRQELNALYASAAMAAEQVNGARVAAEAAEREIADLDVRLRDATGALDRETEAVAELTIVQWSEHTQVNAWQSLLTSAGPNQLLERSLAYRSTQEALGARVADFEATQAVVSVISVQAEDAAERKREALQAEEAAQAAIVSALAAAESRAAQLEVERDAALEQLAVLQEESLEAVTARQDDIDERIDASGPQPELVQAVSSGSTPSASPTDSAPAPALSAQPTTAAPTQAPRTQAPRPQPAPTTAAPAPQPAPQPTRTPTPTPAPQPKPSPTPAPAPKNAVETTISYAMAQLGKPYQWGGSGPNSFDCSGLTMRALQSAGISVSHHAGTQYSQTRSIRVADRQRGDLLYWSNGSASSIYHVAIYLGNGQMIHAPRPGRSVEIVPFTYWIAPDLASRPY